LKWMRRRNNMLLLLVGVALVGAGVEAVIIPATGPCVQQALVRSACDYGNLTVAAVGTLLKPKNCNGHVNLTTFDHPPYLYINSTNATERFTVVMVDLGPQGRGPDYLQWMITNISINTPNYQTIPPNNILAGYTPPLVMPGQPPMTLVQILVFRHKNVLRVPFGELWITRRRNFSLSQLFSNTGPTLQLCGPVAGAQFWVHSPADPVYVPSAPPLPSAPVQPGYVPMVPAQPGFVPMGSAPGQPGYVPPHPPAPHRPTSPKKSAGVIVQPTFHVLFVPLVVATVMFL